MRARRGHGEPSGADADTAEAARDAVKRALARARRKRATVDAIGQETEASRVALLALLRGDLATLEARGSTETLRQSARSSARRIIQALVARYGIEL